MVIRGVCSTTNAMSPRSSTTDNRCSSTLVGPKPACQWLAFVLKELCRADQLWGGDVAADPPGLVLKPHLLGEPTDDRGIQGVADSVGR